MTRRAPPAAAPAAAFLLVLLLLLAPSALADHVYSHRYVVAGRVVDAGGLPVANVTVDVAHVGFRAEGPCHPSPGGATDAWSDGTQATTDARGEFRICLHAHAVGPGAALHATLRDAGGAILAQRELPADARFRATYAQLVVEDVAGAEAPEGHLVAARLWAPWVPDHPLDGVPVRGLALVDAEVEVAALEDGRDAARVTTRTSGYGDLAVRLPHETARADALRLTTGEHAFFARPDGSGFTGLKLELPPVAEAILIGGSGQWQTPQGERNPDVRVLPGAHVSLLVVDALDAPLTFHVEGQPPARTLTSRGDHAWVNFTAPQEGTLRYWSAEGRAQGMEGRIVVVPSDASDVARLALVPDEAVEGFAWRAADGGEPALTAAPGQWVAIAFAGGRSPHAPSAGDYALPAVAGENRTMHFQAPDEGEVEIVCLVHPDTMRAVLRVADAPPAATTPAAPTGPTAGTPTGATPTGATPTGTGATPPGEAAPTQRTDALAPLLVAGAAAAAALLLRRR